MHQFTYFLLLFCFICYVSCQTSKTVELVRCNSPALPNFNGSLSNSFLTRFSQQLQKTSTNILESEIQLAFNSSNFLRVYDQADIDFTAIFTNSEFDAYLLWNTRNLYESLNKTQNTESFYITQDIAAPVYPFLVEVNAGESDTSFNTGEFFLRVLHSSVWSFILLSAVLIAILLFIFENTQPFAYGLQDKWNDGSSINLIECFELVCCTLLFRNYHKTVTSMSSRILILFWYTFIFIFFLTFIVGSGIFIMGNPSLHKTKALSKTTAFPLNGCFNNKILQQANDTILCDSESTICGWMTTNSEGQRSFQRIFGNSVRIQSVSEPLEKALMSNKRQFILSTSFTLSEKIDILSVTEKSVKVFVVNQIQSSVVLLVKTQSLANKINRLISEIKISGGMNELSSWLFVNEATDTTCSLKDESENTVPIRLSNFWNPFILLLVGMVISLLTLAAEFTYRSLILKEHLKLIPNDGSQLQ